MQCISRPIGNRCRTPTLYEREVMTANSRKQARLKGAWLLFPFLTLTACGPSFMPHTISWEARCDELVTGKFQACYGPGWHADGPPDRPYENYRLSVERVVDGGSETIFWRTLPASDVPDTLLRRDHPTIVEFDRRTGEVTFLVGRRRIQAFVGTGHDT